MKKQLLIITTCLQSLFGFSQVAGTLDSTFSQNGIIHNSIGSLPYDVATSMAIQEDGKIVLAGLWDFGDGSTSTLRNPLHEYADKGTYDVCLHISMLLAAMIQFAFQ